MKTAITLNSNSVNEYFGQFILSTQDMISVRGGEGDPIPSTDHPPVRI
jgi:hypothetical protein